MWGAGSERDFRQRLTLIVSFGALLRIVRLIVDKWGQPLLLNDSLYYSAQAQQLAHGVWFREVFVDQPGAEHGPLTSTLMSLVSWGNSPFDRQRLVTVVCGIATVAIIGLVGRRVGGDRVGLIAAAIAAVYPNLWISDGLVMSESVSCLLIVAGTVGNPRVDRPPDAARRGNCRCVRRARHVGSQRGDPVRSGRSGRDVDRRPQVCVASPADACDRRRRGRARSAPAMDDLQPGPVREADLLDDERRRGSLRSELRRHLLRPGTGRLVAVVPGQRPIQRSRRRHIAARRASTARGDRLRSRPPVERAAGRAATRSGRTLDMFALRDMVRGDAGEERERWAAWLGIVSFWVLAPIAVFGAIKTRRRDRAVLLIPVMIALVTTVVIYGGHRIRSSAEPSIVVFAAVAIGYWLNQRRSDQGSDSPDSIPAATGAASSP